MELINYSVCSAVRIEQEGGRMYICGANDAATLVIVIIDWVLRTTRMFVVSPPTVIVLRMSWNRWLIGGGGGLKSKWGRRLSRNVGAHGYQWRHQVRVSDVLGRHLSHWYATVEAHVFRVPPTANAKCDDCDGQWQPTPVHFYAAHCGMSLIYRSPGRYVRSLFRHSLSSLVGICLHMQPYSHLSLISLAWNWFASYCHMMAQWNFHSHLMKEGICLSQCQKGFMHSRYLCCMEHSEEVGSMLVSPSSYISSGFLVLFIRRFHWVRLRCVLCLRSQSLSQLRPYLNCTNAK